MKILLTVNNNNSPMFAFDQTSSIRNLFSSVSHLVWVKKIVSADSFHPSTYNNPGKQFLVTCKPQGSTLENEALAREVLNTLGYNGNVTVNKISISPTIQPEAVEKLGENDFSMDPAYGRFMARNDAYRKSLLDENITGANVEYKVIGPGLFKTTGKISTESRKLPDNQKGGFNTKNIYHCLSSAISNNEKLRKKLINSDVTRIEIHKENEENIEIDVTSSKSFSIPLSKPEKNEAKGISALSKQLNDAKISDLETQDQIASPSMRRR